MEWYVGTEWKSESRGLRKKVLELDFQKIEKPLPISKVIITVEDVQNLEGRSSKYLSSEAANDRNQELEMGTALTPIDYYLEMLVQQMMPGEKGRCYIKTNQASKPEIEFTVTLQRIMESKGYYDLEAHGMYELALKYKENGVAMYKEYPKFAHDYFSRAAKCLISLKPFENLSEETDGVSCQTAQALFTHIQTNLAACLLTEHRYEDVIYQTEFVENPAEQSSEKSIYRRAMAFFNIKEYAKAQATIECVPNYLEKPDFLKLHQSIKKNWKTSNEDYKSLVQRMFADINKN